MVRPGATGTRLGACLASALQHQYPGSENGRQVAGRGRSRQSKICTGTPHTVRWFARWHLSWDCCAPGRSIAPDGAGRTLPRRAGHPRRAVHRSCQDASARTGPSAGALRARPVADEARLSISSDPMTVSARSTCSSINDDNSLWASAVNREPARAILGDVPAARSVMPWSSTNTRTRSSGCPGCRPRPRPDRRCRRPRVPSVSSVGSRSQAPGGQVRVGR